ncbi:hypothetical protein B5J94_12995 [Moraxella lacunata]|uniref:Uncharacterized protein n=1 Tax=Moraxella lacunata TaxID=477 RepID=A0A1V4GM77_MORLA|nr:hypothetical protein B5J94_12995 [Moraxella lacunata]
MIVSGFCKKDLPKQVFVMAVMVQKVMLQRKLFVVSLSNHDGFPTRRHSSGRTENLVWHTF